MSLPDSRKFQHRPVAQEAALVTRKTPSEAAFPRATSLMAVRCPWPETSQVWASLPGPPGCTAGTCRLPGSPVQCGPSRGPACSAAGPRRDVLASCPSVTGRVWTLSFPLDDCRAVWDELQPRGPRRPKLGEILRPAPAPGSTEPGGVSASAGRMVQLNVTVPAVTPRGGPDEGPQRGPGGHGCGA